MRAAVFCLLFLPHALAAGAHKAPPRPPAFDFKARLEKLPRQRSLLERLLSGVDGGDMNGWPHPDGTQRKPDNLLRTFTLRWKLEF